MRDASSCRDKGVASTQLPSRLRFHLLNYSPLLILVLGLPQPTASSWGANNDARTCPVGVQYCDPTCVAVFGAAKCDHISANPAHASPYTPESTNPEAFDFCQRKRSSEYADQICCPLTDKPDHNCAMKTFTCFEDSELLPASVQDVAGTRTWKDFKDDVGVGKSKRTHPVYIEVSIRGC